MHHTEYIEGFVTPAIRLVQGRGVIGPFDPEDPIVAYREPGQQENGQDEAAKFTPSRDRSIDADFQPAATELSPQQPSHLDAPQCAPNDHVDRDMRFARTVADELDPWKLRKTKTYVVTK